MSNLNLVSAVNNSIWDGWYDLFNVPSAIRFNTLDTKDMKPISFKRWIEKDENGLEIERGAKAICRTVGIAPEDINVTLDGCCLIVDGKTETEDGDYSQHFEQSLSSSFVCSIKDVNFKSENGITTIYFELDKDSKKINVKRLGA